MKSQNKARPIPRRTVIALFLFGIGIFVVSNWDVHNRWVELRENGKITYGIVIDIKKMAINKNLKTDCCYYFYIFNKEQFNFKICVCPYKIGDTLTIKYNPIRMSEHEIVR